MNTLIFLGLLETKRPKNSQFVGVLPKLCNDRSMSKIRAQSAFGRSLCRGLQLAGLILILGSVGYWMMTGAHTGFSKNRVEVAKIDPITQIEYVDYEERFVPGIEFLSAGTVAGLGLLAVGFFFARK